MKTTKNWFEVSVSGLRELQSGKPKHFILRELIANAFDENISCCEVTLNYFRGIAQIKVSDDNPDGFKDITDSYTLFKSTPKRINPNQRGRFNIGEKQALSCSDYSIILTTKGTVTFDKTGRHFSNTDKTDKGSQILLKVKMTEEEYNEILRMLVRYRSPEKIRFIVNGIVRKPSLTFTEFTASLESEILENEVLHRVWRKTKVQVIKENFVLIDIESYLYEMGIPICSIDCKYSLDVQQKIPLSIDRENVSERFIEELYSETLNSIYEDIIPEEASSTWIRLALANKRISEIAIKSITEKRFGKKVVAANPFDRQSIDEAISSGYNVVYGSELSKKEWKNLRKFGVLQSSSEVFGKTLVEFESVKANEKQLKVVMFAKKIALDFLGIDINVGFIKSKADAAAEYGNRTLTFNLSRLPQNFFDTPLKEETLDLILHELGHQEGMHTEKSYHKALTRLGSKLVLRALTEPEYFTL